MESDSTSKKIMPVDDIWKAVKGQDKWGIEGYEPPKKYIDSRHVKWTKKREEILEKHRRVWPPKDWPVDKETEKAVKPKRPNYLDEVTKWSKSFYDPNKAEKTKDYLSEHGRPMDKTPEKKKPSDRRGNFLENEKNKEEARKNRPECYEEKLEYIAKAKEKLEEWEKEKEKESKRKKRGKGSLPLCARITVVADAEHGGEKLPFYNTFKKEGDDDDGEGKKKKKKLFFPDVSEIIIIYNI